MISFAFKMLIGNRAACIGVIFGIFLATLLISQQSAIFLGLVARSYRVVSDISEPNLWVMDPATESEDKVRSLPISYLDIVRGAPGVEWAVPLNSTLLPVVTPLGKFEICHLYGIDDATLIGAPFQMFSGHVQDLRREGAVIVDIHSAQSSLSRLGEDGRRIPLDIGDVLEINGKRAVVVGICQVTQGFYPQPIMFTAFSQFHEFAPGTANHTGFILAKTHSEENVDKAMAFINSYSGLHALTRQEFKDRIVDFFLKTGILINFGLSVLLGLIIGFSIAGQTFYIMTLENISYYALIKAVGGTSEMILKMIIFQAAVVGSIGYALGMGASVLWGMAIKGTTLAFLFPWQLLLFTGAIVVLICIFTATVSIQKVLRVDPKMLMGT